PGGKVQAVRGIDFDLYKGETLAIVGESGSGKSVTNRAIIGILANNSIVENGKIIYDGKDLLKISEEDFHSIRGDKIAMIFQDPLSSLNPIMRIGKQITEAMLLKNKTSRKSSKREFNSKLMTLKSNMIEALGKDPVTLYRINDFITTFDKFSILALQLEHDYNINRTHLEEVDANIADIIFNVERKQKVDAKSTVKKLVKKIKRIKNSFLVAKFADKIRFAIQSLKASLKSIKKAQRGKLSVENLGVFAKTSTLIKEILGAEKPNFFRIGYYKYRHPNEDLTKQDIVELNAKALKYLDKYFMKDFIKMEVKALNNSREKALKAKKSLIPVLSNLIMLFESKKLKKKKVLKSCKKVYKKIFSAIDQLDIVKDSGIYTFQTSLSVEVDKYFKAKKNNPKEQKRFDKQTKKKNKLLKKGKKVDWKVLPLSLVDLDEQIETIVSVVASVREKFEKDILKEVDYKEKAVNLIDYFKEKASGVVNIITKGIARERAIKLMEEVGIPQPRIRYKQYPFEFSGGMRQRIVIAIALAADPDILICDEPTTALDVTIQAQILELINKLKRERNLSIIFITHDLGVVANMADRIAVMYAGKIVEYGTSEDIFYDPRHPYTWALLSSMPDLNTNEKLESIPGTPPNMIYPPVGDAFASRNKYALEIDFEEQPPFFDVSETHKAATWLLHPDAPKVEIPRII
ncbi:MAG: ABC transporter ATP-binding protein, partial [Clostridia bacterium]|nr:ABC transporter ATP-binding protein [Clostridia bacterium]